MCMRLRACTRSLDLNSELQLFCLAPLPRESETLGKGGQCHGFLSLEDSTHHFHSRMRDVAAGAAGVRLTALASASASWAGGGTNYDCPSVLVIPHPRRLLHASSRISFFSFSRGMDLLPWASLLRMWAGQALCSHPRKFNGWRGATCESTPDPPGNWGTSYTFWRRFYIVGN